ncbi:hypothetical protein N7495_006549 [Penicillium taxi]|uniref:uncharacterized protein n=1 Tax=Penicillium taxi TaxID=168475 RepID=UPI0025459094|nr:uncharacterized protein N7495_006549 [Penicillium taxi]KAJ5894858.1 hypothetical protein N7495_006549 [Penicillium taxi]
MAPSTPKININPTKSSGSGIKKKSARAPRPVLPNDAPAIMTPSDATMMEKNLFRLWAFYKTTSNVIPRHGDIAEILGITNQTSRNRFAAIRALMGLIQIRAEKEAPSAEEKTKNAEGDEAEARMQFSKKKKKKKSRMKKLRMKE